MRGDRPLLAMGFMSPQFKALAASQDLIGWRDFTEGHISTHFYVIQSFHLAMSSSHLNGEDWIKQFIPRILQLTHSQWIFRNISLHDKHMDSFAIKWPTRFFNLQLINEFSEVAPEEVPKDSQFLLEIISLSIQNLISKPKPIGHWQWMWPLRPKHWNRLKVHGPSEYVAD